MSDPTYAQAKEHIQYQPIKGDFIRIKQSGNSHVGDIAGTVDKKGYRIIRIANKPIKAHRLAFLLMTGKIPKMVDHKNHIRDDNRWSNLRSISYLANCRNRSRARNNKSGTTGVRQVRSKKFEARIIVAGEEIHLGTYSTIDEAIKAREDANTKYGFSFLHGQPSEVSQQFRLSLQ